MGEKERFEVWLEEIRGEVKVIAEGLVSLRSELRTEMAGGFRSVRQEIADLRIAFQVFARQSEQRFAALEAKVFKN